MKVRHTTVVTLALALLLGAGVAVSQTAGEHHGFSRGMGPEGHMLAKMTEYLGLTDAQQAQAKQIFQAEKPTVKPLMQQLHQSEQQMQQLITSGNFDEAKAREIASQESQTRTELEVQRAKVHAQIFNLLTADQKTKAKRDERGKPLARRRELRGGQTPAAPEETDENAEVVEEWNVVASSSGHRAPKVEQDDDNLGEQLVADGVEEAVHDQMVEARKEELDQEG